jgi:RNA polymerase sigma-70 factor, ECF subfamily
MTTSSVQLLAAIERNRKRVWRLCYRMTGQRADADDLSQEALAKAIERGSQAVGDDPTGWLLRLATRVCIDHLRHKQVVRRVTELADPLLSGEWSLDDETRAPDCAAILREDLRFAVVVALQSLSARQRAAVVLHDVCACSLDETAEALDTNANAVKALLQRARVALRAARLRQDIDVPVDRAVVEQFAVAIEAGSIESLTALLAEDVWGIVDGGGIVQAPNKPTFGRTAVSRQWSNGRRRLDRQPAWTRIVTLNGEPAIVLGPITTPDLPIAVVHFDTRESQVCALRVNVDPRKAAFCLTAP